MIRQVHHYYKMQEDKVEELDENVFPGIQTSVDNEQLSEVESEYVQPVVPDQKRRNLPKTEQNQQAILEYLRAGKKVKESCFLVKINAGTYHKWLQTDFEFSEAVRKIRQKPGVIPPSAKANIKKISVESVMEEMEALSLANPTKKPKEINSMYLESQRTRIIAWLFDTAANADTETAKKDARFRLKDELDGRVATQDKRDPDEDNAIGKILIPEEM